MRYLSNHFKLKFKKVKIKEKIIKLYLELKKKEKKTDAEKQDLKRLRHIFRQPIYVLEATLKDQTIEADYPEKPTRKDIKDLLDKLRVQYQKSKQNKLKVEPPKVLDFYGVKLERVGLVYTKLNSILDADKGSKKNSPDHDKKPRTNVNCIGIELEFNNRSDMYAEQRIIKEYLIEKKLGKYTRLTTDGSCGHELRVLLEEPNYSEPLKKIMDGLVELGYSCDDRCGTHVHIDMRHRDVKRVYKNLVHVQDIMYKLVTKKRRTNNFCQKNRFMTFEEASTRENRYVYVNSQAYGRHKTLEVRLHHGTLSFDELNQWLKLLLKIVNYEGEITQPITKLTDFSKTLKMNKDEAVELRKRYKTYNAKLPLGIGA